MMIFCFDNCVVFVVVIDGLVCVCGEMVMFWMFKLVYMDVNVIEVRLCVCVFVMGLYEC